MYDCDALSLVDLGKALAAQCQIPKHARPENLVRWCQKKLKKKRMLKKFLGRHHQRMVPAWLLVAVEISRRRNAAQEGLYGAGFQGFLDPRQPFTPNGGIWIRMNPDGSRDIFRVAYDGEVSPVATEDHFREVNVWLRGGVLQPIDRRIAEAIVLHEQRKNRKARSCQRIERN